MNRGDVVIVQFPFVNGRHGKNRPAVVVQNNRDNQQMTNTIVAMISGNIRRASEPTQLFVDPATDEGRSSGLHGPSVVKCNNLFTVAQEDILRVIGSLTDELLAKLDECLRIALELR